MAVSRLWCRAEYRQRWVQHLTVAVLIGFVGAAVLTCAAAARRTNSAYARFLDAQSIAHVEASLADGDDLAAITAKLRAIEGVEAVGAYDALFVAPNREDILPGQNFMIFTPLDDTYTRTLDRLVVTEGRMPDPAATDEVIVNERAVKNFELGIGSQFTARSISQAERKYMEAGDFAKITFAGPEPTLRVVGIGRARVDLTGSSYVNQYAVATPAYAKKYGNSTYSYGAQIDVRYSPDADREATDRAVSNVIGTEVNQLDEAGTALQDTARTQAVALALIGLTALLAGALVISQTISRMLRSSRPDVVGLRELGVDRATTVGATTLAFLPAALAGGAIALIGGWVGTRWFPTGLVGQAEVHPGMRADPFVFIVGTIVILGLVVVRVALGAMRLTAPEPPRRATHTAWTDRAAAAFSPASGTGVRWAIGRAEGNRPLTGILAAIVGVAGLLAVTTYTDQLEHIVSTPRAFGQFADQGVEVGNDAAVLGELRDFVVEQDSVADVVAYTLASRVGVNDVTMQAWTFEGVRGELGPSVVQGRAPTRDTEALVGSKSAQQLGIGIGDRVHVTTPNDDQELTIVGTGLFPISDTDAIATGVVTTKRVFDALAPEDPRMGVGFNWKAGTDVAAEIARFSEAGVEITPNPMPPDIANMRVVRSYPWWLAGFLVALAMLATTNALVVSSRRRRHEMAILGAIGLSRRQLTAAVATLGATVGLLAAVVGVPLGLLAGKWLWTAHADRIGLSPSIALPTGIAVAVGAATVTLTCMIALAAGWGALRTRLATALRSE